MVSSNLGKMTARGLTSMKHSNIWNGSNSREYYGVMTASHRTSIDKDYIEFISFLESIQLLSRIKKIEDSKLIPLLKRKKKLYKSKIDHALHARHMHYFSKHEVMEFRNNNSLKSIIDPRCVVCGLRLTQYLAEKRYETMEIPAYKGDG